MVQIEIDLAKIERGTHVGRVKVTRGGKTFWREQRVGVKEVEKPEMTDSEIGTAFCSGKKIPLTVDNVSRDRRIVTINFKEPEWRAEITSYSYTESPPIKPGSRIVKWHKTFKETDMVIYKNDRKVMGYNTRKTEDKDDATQKRITKAGVEVANRIKKATGVSLEYDPISHEYITDADVEANKKREIEHAKRAKQEEADKKVRQSEMSDNAKDLIVDIKSLSEDNTMEEIGDIFANKPEIIYSLISRINNTRKDVFSDPNIFGSKDDYDWLSAENRDFDAVNALHDFFMMSEEKALEYIKNPDNRRKVGSIIMGYQTAYEMKM
jgi:hypothetical protein